MVIRFYAFIFLIFTSLCSADWLQEKAETWPSVCSAKYTLAQAQAAYDEAVAAFYPHLSASTGFYRTQAQSSQAISPDYYVANASIELNLNLLTNGLSNFYRIFQRELTRDQAKLRYRQTLQQTRAQLLSLLSLCESKEKWTRLYQEQADLYQQVLANTEHAYARGQFSDLFVSNARLQLQSSMVTLEESRMQLRVQRSILDSLSISTGTASVNWSDKILQVISENIENLPLMISANFDIMLQHLEEKKQYWVRMESQSTGYPSLRVYIQRTFGRNDEAPARLLEDPLQPQNSAFGILVNWPLFSPTNFAQSNGAEMSYRKSQADKDYALWAAQNTLSTGYQQIRFYLSQYQRSTLGLHIAEHNLNQTNDLYKRNLISYLELQNTFQSCADIRTRAMQYRDQCISGWLELGKAFDIPLEDTSHHE